MASEDVHGLQALLDSMEGLKLSQQKNVIARSLRKAAAPIIAEIKRRAPNDPKTPGSSIAESIIVQVTEQTADGAIAKIGPSKHGFAAIWAEVGGKNQPARPFIGPAFDSTVDKAYELLADELGDAIEREFAKRK